MSELQERLRNFRTRTVAGRGYKATHTVATSAPKQQPTQYDDVVRPTSEDYVFTDGDKYTTIADKKHNDYPDRVMTVRVQGPAKPISMISPIDDSAKEAALYSYVAAIYVTTYDYSPNLQQLM